MLTCLLAAVAMFAMSYRIALVGVAENFSRSDPEQALRLSPRLPLALRARVEQLRLESPRDSAQIERMLRQSLSTDPVEGRSFGLLGLEAAHQGRAMEADRLLEAGIHRAPRDIHLRGAALSRSLRDDRLEDAVRHIVAVLRVRPDRADEPIQAHEYVSWLWQVYSGSAEGREAVTKLALAPSPWRVAFLGHIAAHSAPAEALHLMGVLQQRKLSTTTNEFDTVVRALLSRREWRAAFALWMQDPARSEETRIPNLYNGDFSKFPDARPGFDWELSQPQGARTTVEDASGGQRQLRIDLVPRHAVAGALARHLLVLGPGSYELRTRARSEGPAPDHVAVFRLSCLHSAGTTPIASLKLDRGSSTWKTFATSAVVPTQDCAAQQLDLEIESLSGAPDAQGAALWLDDVSVTRATRAYAAGSGNPRPRLPPDEMR